MILNFEPYKEVFVAFYSPNNTKNFVEILASCGFKNRLAKKTDLQSFKCSCSSVAPRPLCDASDFTLVLSFMSKSVFSISLSFSDLFSSKAMVCSPEQVNISFLYKGVSNGLRMMQGSERN